MTELEKMLSEYNKSPFHSHLTISDEAGGVIPGDIPADKMHIIKVNHCFNFDYDTVMVDIHTPSKNYSLLGKVERRAFDVYKTKKDGVTK